MTPARSFWQRHRWLVLRRLSQLSVLGLFAGSGALAGWRRALLEPRLAPLL